MIVLRKPLIISMSLSGTILVISLINNIFISSLPWLLCATATGALFTILKHLFALKCQAEDTMSTTDLFLTYLWALIWLFELGLEITRVVRVFSHVDKSSVLIEVLDILTTVLVLGEAGLMWYIAIKGHVLSRRNRTASRASQAGRSVDVELVVTFHHP